MTMTMIARTSRSVSTLRTRFCRASKVRERNKMSGQRVRTKSVRLQRILQGVTKRSANSCPPSGCPPRLRTAIEPVRLTACGNASKKSRTNGDNFYREGVFETIGVGNTNTHEFDRKDTGRSNRIKSNRIESNQT